MPDITTTKKILEIAFRAGVTPLLVSHTGMGKSDIVKQVCHKLYGEKNEDGSTTFIDIRLGQKEVGDLTGIPFSEKVDKIFKTIWALPEMYPMSGKGVIFLDEINRASSQDVINCIFQLIYDRQLHTYLVPKGYAICAAMNPSDGKYQVLMTDDAFTARCIILDVYPKYDEWLKWAESPNGLQNEELKNFARTLKGNEQNNFLFRGERINMKNCGYEIKPRPRSWEIFDKMIKYVDPNDEKMITEIGLGIVGMELTSAFIRFKKESYERPLLGEQVIEEFPKYKEIVQKWCSPKQIKGDLIATTSRNIYSYIVEKLNNESPVKPKTEIFANIWNYVSILQKNAVDQASEFLNRLFDQPKDEKSITNFTDELTKYINKNKKRLEEFDGMQEKVG